MEKVMSRLMGDIVSSVFSNQNIARESTKAFGSFLLPAKEKVDPQTLFRVYEDVDEHAAKEDEPPRLTHPRTIAVRTRPLVICVPELS
ncbi:hypothetical protein JG687_00011962 [Phytophthora cactorum]|uniref:Uncharacterized protein n=1 Tax=Phytophthora cactorum TaxID=29920 RepID=A0A8T1U2Y4_9STRA|nr:hypothetical protein JG687_00011962 [Phytophthora cactorum]